MASRRSVVIAWHQDRVLSLHGIKTVRRHCMVSRQSVVIAWHQDRALSLHGIKTERCVVIAWHQDRVLSLHGIKMEWCNSIETELVIRQILPSSLPPSPFLSPSHSLSFPPSLPLPLPPSPPSPGTYLLSGGEESVLVLWQLDTHTRQFRPRLGSPIVRVACSPGDSYFCISLQSNGKGVGVVFSHMRTQSHLLPGG